MAIGGDESLLHEDELDRSIASFLNNFDIASEETQTDVQELIKENLRTYLNEFNAANSTKQIIPTAILIKDIVTRLKTPLQNYSLTIDPDNIKPLAENISVLNTLQSIFAEKSFAAKKDQRFKDTLMTLIIDNDKSTDLFRAAVVNAAASNLNITALITALAKLEDPALSRAELGQEFKSVFSADDAALNAASSVIDNLFIENQLLFFRSNNSAVLTALTKSLTNASAAALKPRNFFLRLFSSDPAVGEVNDVYLKIRSLLEQNAVFDNIPGGDTHAEVQNSYAEAVKFTQNAIDALAKKDIPSALSNYTVASRFMGLHYDENLIDHYSTQHYTEEAQKATKKLVLTGASQNKNLVMPLTLNLDEENELGGLIGTPVNISPINVSPSTNSRSGTPSPTAVTPSVDPAMPTAADKKMQLFIDDTRSEFISALRSLMELTQAQEANKATVDVTAREVKNTQLTTDIQKFLSQIETDIPEKISTVLNHYLNLRKNLDDNPDSKVQYNKVGLTKEVIDKSIKNLQKALLDLNTSSMPGYAAIALQAKVVSDKSFYHLINQQLKSGEVVKRQAAFDTLLQLITIKPNNRAVQSKYLAMLVKGIHANIQAFPEAEQRDKLLALETAANQLSSIENQNIPEKKMTEDQKTQFGAAKTAVDTAVAALLQMITTHRNAIVGTENKEAQWQLITAEFLRAPIGKIGELFATVVPTVTNNPSNLDLLQAFESPIQKNGNSMGLANARFVSPKSGGANDPGPLGANYLLPYQTADGNVHLKMVFFKRPTDDDVIVNHQEGIAEVFGGRMMNIVDPRHSAPTLAALAPGGKMGDPNSVYVGSVFHNDYEDLFRAGWVASGNENPIPSRAGNGKMEKIIERFSATKKTTVEKGLNAIFLEAGTSYKGNVLSSTDQARLRESFGEASMASLLVGNYQIHSENMGIAKVDGHYEVVSLDYGGAGRRAYQTNLVTMKSSPIASGRFERTVDPLGAEGKKYGLAYFGLYPKALRRSEEAIRGYDKIANFDRATLEQGVIDNVEYGIRFYGMDAYRQHFAAELDTRDGGKNALHSMDPETFKAAAIEFLTDAMLARQLSIKEFSLASKLKIRKKDPSKYPDVISDNPYYALREKLLKANNVTDFIRHDVNPVAQRFNQIIANDFAKIKFDDSRDSIQPYAMQMLIRMNLICAELQENDAVPLDNATQKAKADLVDLRKFLTLAFRNKTYDLESSKADRHTMVMACDEAFLLMRKALLVMPQNLADACFTALDNMQPIAGPATPIPVISALDDDELVGGGLEVDDGSEDEELDAESKNENYDSDEENDPSHDELDHTLRSSARTASDSSLTTTPHPLTSPSVGTPSSTGLFHPPHGPKPAPSGTFFEKLLSYMAKVKDYFDSDSAVRRAMESGFGNARSASLASSPSILDEEKPTPAQQQLITEIQAKVTAFQANSLLSTMPSNVVRSDPIPTSELEESLSIPGNTLRMFVDAMVDTIEANPPAHPDKVIQLQNDQSIFNFVLPTEAKPDEPLNLKECGCFMEQMKNDRYSIDTLQLQASLNRTKIVNSFLINKGINPNADGLNAIVKDFVAEWKKYEKESYKNATHDRPLREEFYQAFKDKFSAFPGINCQEIMVALEAATLNPIARTTGKSYPSDEYLIMVDKQIQRFIAQAGSDKRIKIKATTDPLLAQAYVLMCNVHGLKFNNKANDQYNIIVDNPMLHAIKRKIAAGGMLSEPVDSLGKLQNFVSELWKLKDGLSDENERKLEKLHNDVYDHDKTVSPQDAITLATELSVAIRNTPPAPPKPSTNL
jgi:hypothetical protein